MTLEQTLAFLQFPLCGAGKNHLDGQKAKKLRNHCILGTVASGQVDRGKTRRTSFFFFRGIYIALI